MARVWFSYVVLAIGLMMLFASDKHTIAENKESETKVISFSDKKDIQVFVNKQGDNDSVVDLMINGEKYSFSVPDLTDGETKVLTTEDGKEITLKAFSNKSVVFIGDDEIPLPGLHTDSVVSTEGLSSVISRVHEVADFSSRGPSPWGDVRPHVVAPGVKIYSAEPGGTYGVLPRADGPS